MPVHLGRNKKSRILLSAKGGVAAALVGVSGCGGGSSFHGLIADPVAAAVPSALNFGSISVGHPETLAIAIRNDGIATLQIDSAIIEGPNAPDFALPTGMPLDATAPPGASITWNVTFTPRDAGAESATLEIATNAAVPTVSVVLTGQGGGAADGG